MVVVPASSSSLSIKLTACTVGGVGGSAIATVTVPPVDVAENPPVTESSATVSTQSSVPSQVRVVSPTVMLVPAGMVVIPAIRSGLPIRSTVYTVGGGGGGGSIATATVTVPPVEVAVNEPVTSSCITVTTQSASSEQVRVVSPTVTLAPAATVVIPGIRSVLPIRSTAAAGGGGSSITGSSITGSSPPPPPQPYMTAERATIEHAAINLRVRFIFFMAPRLSSF